MIACNVCGMPKVWGKDCKRCLVVRHEQREAVRRRAAARAEELRAGDGGDRLAKALRELGVEDDRGAQKETA